jgi:hypothetical protein
MQDAIALMLGTTVLSIGLGFGFTLGARLFDAQSDLFDRLTNAVIKKLKKGK